jgi:hypothetical protein
MDAFLLARPAWDDGVEMDDAATVPKRTACRTEAVTACQYTPKPQNYKPEVLKV